MNDLVFRGIILKQSDYGDAHRMLSVFTESDGIIKFVRYGIKGKKSNNAAAYQILTYGDFKLRPSRGDIMTAVGCDVLDGFYPISEDITKLSLLSYLADITYTFLGENNPDQHILSLFLNTVYAAAYRNEPLLKLKAVYELKLMCSAGYMPSLGSCGVCGSDSAEYFSPDRGTAVCREHINAGDMRMSQASQALMRHIIASADKKMFSFNAKDESYYIELNEITEKYVSRQADKVFSSLNYFKAMLI